MKKLKAQSNLWKLNLINAIGSFMLIMPVIVLFFRENGLTMSQILLLQSLFSAAVILLEIPSGYYADIFGRKKSIILGSCLALLGYAVYSLSYGFWGFLVAELILGFGTSFMSGADSAMIYDSLMDLGRENEYQKIQGKYTSIQLISEGSASVIGGLLALISLRFPLYCETIVLLAAIPLAMSLSEPQRREFKKEGNGIRSLLKLIKYSLHDHAEIKWLIIYSSVVSASTLTMAWFIQPYLSNTGIPLVYFGIIWAALLFFSSFLSWQAHRVEKIMGRKFALMSMIFLPAVGYLLLSFAWVHWSFLFLFLFYFARGINNPITADYVNRLISSDMRATILSVKNFIGRVIFAAIGPIVGWANDIYSLKDALLFSGGIFFFFGLVSLLFLKKHKAL